MRPARRAAGSGARGVGEPRPRVIAALARRHVRRIARQRLILWTVLVAGIAWYLTRELRGQLPGLLAIVLLPTLFAVLVTGAGVVADDLDSGTHLLDVMHGASPLELSLGAATGVTLSTLPSLLLLSCAALAAGAAERPLVFAVLLAWLVVLVADWGALAVLLGALVPAKGNAVLLLPLFLFGAFPPHELPVGALPAPLQVLARTAWTALPLPAHLMAIRDALVHGTGGLLVPATALLAAGPVYLFLAAVRLTFIEPAARWSR